MRAAEAALIAAGSSTDALMRIAGEGAADWVFRLAWPRTVTVLCGPGNNGGDGYVIAESLRRRGLDVAVVAPLEPKTDAAGNARALYAGAVLKTAGGREGGTLVDCLFGSGLMRPLSDELHALLGELAAGHPHRVAVDLASGVESDSGRPLNDGLPRYDLTIALGAWKFAHWTMPASARMGARRLVPIGVSEVPGAARLLARPVLSAPAPDAHKYTRGLLVVMAGEMPGAGLLACAAAMHGGAGYVKLDASSIPQETPPELVVEAGALDDPRAAALLVGPGLGRGDAAKALLARVLARKLPTVLDADALMLLGPDALSTGHAPRIATPHQGELAALAGAFGIEEEGKLAIAQGLATRAGMVVIAKGPDTVIAAPDGRLTIAPPASSWLSTAGTGDVLAGLVASRLATGVDAFDAACEGVWLHGEAARIAGPGLAAGDLARAVPQACAVCL